MSIQKLFVAMALSFGVSSAAWALQEGKDYETLPKPMPQVEKDKIEVQEFFSYTCIHCRRLDPILLKKVKTFPSDVYFHTDHVVWDHDTQAGFARLTVAVNQAGVKNQANPLIFKATFDDNMDLNDPNITAQWLASQTAFDGKKVLAAYNSFSNQTQARQMADRTREFNIQATPTVIIGGKYKVLFPDGFEAGMTTIDELINKVRNERGMTKPAPKPAVKTPKSKGASFAISAAL